MNKLIKIITLSLLLSTSAFASQLSESDEKKCRLCQVKTQFHQAKTQLQEMNHLDRTRLAATTILEAGVFSYLASELSSYIRTHSLQRQYNTMKIDYQTLLEKTYSFKELIRYNKKVSLFLMGTGAILGYFAPVLASETKTS